MHMKTLNSIKKWFDKNKIEIKSIKTHEDLKELPIITGDTIKKKSAPIYQFFQL